MTASSKTAHPVATKRVLRAILKATDLCATEPTRVARQIVDGGFTPRYDYAAQTLSELPYDKWREYDHEDTMRFYALRMHEVGFIKSTPQKIIAEGTDWRFLNELKGFARIPYCPRAYSKNTATTGGPRCC
jgi:NitT/TauT family transport system substrate-binding protein